MSLSNRQKELIRATVPILKSNGAQLTAYFYNRMFTHHPQLKPIFNQGNQASGAQSKALANAVLAYASNIDNPSVLASALDLIAHKHTSVGIRREHYPIVGMHLLASIKEVVGQEIATQELLDAWGVAYNQLAQILIDMEVKLYAHSALEEGGWSGWRGFEIDRIVKETDEVSSFYLKPQDGGKVQLHQPGQYISVKLPVNKLGFSQIRQYSLSCAPNQQEYRITVKRELETSTAPQGTISNALHSDYQAGSIIELSAPAGDFVLDNEDAPVVLISGGVGITPMMSMLEHLHQSQSGRTLWFVHACRSEQHRIFRSQIEKIQNSRPDWLFHLCVENSDVSMPASQPQDGQEKHIQMPSLLDAQQNEDVKSNARFYICGPLPFMHTQYAALIQYGIASERIYMEAFGTGGTSFES